ncbi:MAG: BamA/TamA family outer membrane protein [Lentimicrobium sp.]|nr:BamA/TamA family outer membrane protein [Lentimicrobium sp.]
MSFGLSRQIHLFLSLFLLTGVSIFSFGSNPEEKLLIQDVTIKGNKKTKDYIILRELAFKAGDSLFIADMKQAVSKSAENLMRLPLFHFVNTEIIENSGSRTAEIIIEVTERWYIWLWPVFEISDRNFNAWWKNGDLSRLSYGLFYQQENFRGRLEKLHISAKLGYQQQISLLYEIPYFNQKKTLGAGLILSAGRERETGYITREDKLEYYRANDFLRQMIETSLFLRFRPQIHHSHTLSIGLSRYFFSDTLLYLNPDYTGINKKQTSIPDIGYLMKADYRDNRGYPLKGWYADVLVNGFGLFPNSDYKFFTFRSSARIHIPLYNRWNTALEMASKFSTTGLKPWFLNQALGFNRDYIRGYEYYVIDGDNFLLMKSNIRYALIPGNIIKMPKIKANQFNTIPYSIYLGIFADAGMTWPETKVNSNQLQGKLLGGIGIGLDYVTYYDKVLRAEFSTNRERKTGFFLHFMAAI